MAKNELAKRDNNTAIATLRKRPVAIFTAALMISSSTVFSVHRTLGAECQKITDSFYNGVYEPAWNTTRRSISSQLTKRCEAAAGLISVMNNHGELVKYTEQLKNLRENLIKLSSGHNIGESYSENKKLGEAFADALSELGELELTDREQRMISEYSATFNGAQTLIEAAGYNEAVRDFERSTLNVFPTNILKAIVGGKLPQLFE